MLKKSLLLTAFSLCLFGCSFGDKSKEQENQEPIAEAIPRFVEYEIEKISEELGPCSTDTTSRKCLIINIEYPKITGIVSQQVMEKLNENIQNDILSSTFLSDKPTTFDELKNELETDYNTIIKDFPEYANAWNLEVNSDILYQDSLFISLASTVYSYTGGAHPNSGQMYRSYDLRTGEAIGLADILREGYEEELNQVAEIEFRMTKEIPPTESLEERGYWFENDRFELTENFAIINKSLIFYFNPYEIAPYAMGPTELELKLTDFVSLIKEGGVIENYKN
ncbi:DUF3298 and DUF4163 domain-containing protein [Roseivirga spongicola]|jgi:hypothetical protein|uniref:DUF3298 and DUF4163 domain-containing protein n=1 Tax=Roseivirga spongicola TaxID=333140 RepID=UPI000D793CAA|nr:DUF3298 and DUF4163 domain-containing protein [Roseivirga spongicola]PWL30642.1 MAG: hypothetical protein DCO95_03975 [Roseivirga sp. XM-24bin3]WPZ11648.1 DUF3298 and DUF4163 domain-containing protein [Roseivirga spongicola]